MISRLLLLTVFLSISICGIRAQNNFPFVPIQKFDSKDFNAQPKNRAIAQDRFGRIYIGNKEGLLVYDGTWKKYTIDNVNDVYSVSVSADGRVYVGGKGEFGYFYVDENSKGSLVYHPLYTLLDSADRSELGVVWNVFTLESKVVFATLNHAYIYSKGKIEVVPSQGNIDFFEQFNGQLIAAIDGKGLVVFEKNKFKLISGGATFLNREHKLDIKAITLFKKHYIYIDKENRLWSFTIKPEGIQKKRFITQLDKVFQDITIDRIFSFNSKYIALRSRGNGLFLINEHGDYIMKLDKENGMANGFVEGVFLDKNNILWTAQDGISRVKLFANYEYIPKDKIGVKGKVLGIELFNNDLFISTTYQLYRLYIPNFTTEKDLTLEELKAKKVIKTLAVRSDMTKTATYGLLKIKVDKQEKLLFITDNDIFEINSNNQIDTAIHFSANIMLQDPKDEHRIWLGLYPSGLGSCYLKNGKWEFEDKVPNSDYDIRSLSFDKKGNLWCGTTESLLMLKAPVFKQNIIVNPEIIHYGKESGLPEQDAIFPFFDGQEMIFASSDGFYKQSDDAETFVKATQYPNWFHTHFTYRAKRDQQGNIWAATYGPNGVQLFLKKIQPSIKENYSAETYYAKDVTAKTIESFCEIDSSMWIGGDISDLVRIKNVNQINVNKDIKTYISRIMMNKDTLFNGFFISSDSLLVDKQEKKKRPVLDFEQHDLTFFFSAISSNIEVEPTYSWKLEGYDEGWGEWSDKKEIRYTNLVEGSYVFKVKSKDLYGNISRVADYVFRIKPPWYRTYLAYAIYLIFFVVFVWGVVQISIRGLKRVINEATEEIRMQKEDIEEKGKDILSSIRYAKRIQESVIPQEVLMKKVFPEHFVLWQPRDIVSGDYYWLKQVEGKVLLAAADCTGHGVPGAFMSIMGISFLNEIANNKNINTAAAVLDKLRHDVIMALNQEGAQSDTKDGMDISFCVYDFKNMKMQFAGAYNPLYRIRKGELTVIKADRMPIGIHVRSEAPFTNVELDIEVGDVYYILSDGYIDQFGGPKGKKFMTKRFKELLLAIYDKPMHIQEQLLKDTFIEWRGDIEQLDDIIIVGVKVV